MKKITTLEQADVQGKTVLIRVDYNVPVKDGKVLDDLRIKASFKTVEYFRSLGAVVVLVSHIETKGGGGLKPVAEYINGKFAAGEYPFEVIFSETLFGLQKDEVSAAKPGTVYLLENLRTDEGEKSNDQLFVSRLATLGDLYVNDAFPVAHREHASVIGVPALLPHYAGFQIIDEVEHITKSLNPSHPFIFILGGAKFETKLPLIEKFLQKADKVVIVGALLNDILKAKGYEVGKSLVSDTAVDLAAIAHNPKVMIPSDVVVQNVDTKAVTIRSIDGVQANETIVDVGPSIVTMLKVYIANAKHAGQEPFVLWNGPTGNYEIGFKDQTIAIAKLIMESGIEGLVGGGDTTAAIASLDVKSDKIYVSTGGGAMIEFLVNETLPGIEALK